MTERALLVALVALGGAAGAVVRFAVAGAVQRRRRDLWPAGTLAVNVSGCLLLGFLLGAVGDTRVHAPLLAFLATGFLGDYTTFSTFSLETVSMTRDREWRRAASYVGASVALGIGAAVLGLWLGQFLR